MILILSTSERETTTEKVIDWLSAFNASYVRFNGEDLCNKNLVSVNLNKNEFSLVIDNTLIHSESINVIWYRRFFSYSLINNYLLVESATEVSNKIGRHLYSELKSTLASMLSVSDNIKWVDHPDKVSISKSDQLKFATKVGLNIPQTIITTSRDEALYFLEKCGKIITKCISNGEYFVVGNDIYAHYTSIVSKNDLLNFDSYFLPSLFQEYIEKDIELRVFVLDGKCYSMAIFSQEDERTRVDFRNYNIEKPNRFVSFLLPQIIEEKVVNFMRLAGLITGSIDLIKDLYGKYYFLEVNPVGQFGMVSSPCNYFLEKKMAEYLISCDSP